MKKLALAALAALLLVAAPAWAGYVQKEKDDGSTCFETTGVNPTEVFCLEADGDVVLAPLANGGDQGKTQDIAGRLALQPFTIGASVNGTTNTISALIYIDESPAGEWVGTTNVTDSTDSTVYRIGAASLKLAVVDAAVAGNGADNTLSGGDQDWSADESFGMWMRCDVSTVAGWWVIEITDSSAGATTVNVPAVVANTWTWVEVDISGVADASKNVVQSLGIDLSTAGAAAGAMNCNFDLASKWDGADEETIGGNVITDGVLGIFCMTTANTGTHGQTLLTANTDYFVHYQSGNDAVVMITDQSANSCFGFANIATP